MRITKESDRVIVSMTEREAYHVWSLNEWTERANPQPLPEDWTNAERAVVRRLVVGLAFVGAGGWE
jgi:hypothetical protein